MDHYSTTRRKHDHSLFEQDKEEDEEEEEVEDDESANDDQILTTVEEEVEPTQLEQAPVPSTSKNQQQVWGTPPRNEDDHDLEPNQVDTLLNQLGNEVQLCSMTRHQIHLHQKHLKVPSEAITTSCCTLKIITISLLLEMKYATELLYMGHLST